MKPQNATTNSPVNIGGENEGGVTSITAVIATWR